jgi:hypothetical protein
VAIGAFGFVLKQGEQVYKERQKLPVIACNASSKAAELRDWCSPADLQGIKEIDGLTSQATKAMLKMLVSEKKYRKLSRWLVKYRDDISKLEQKLLRVKRQFTWNISNLPRVTPDSRDSVESIESENDSDAEYVSANSTALQKSNWRNIIVD